MPRFRLKPPFGAIARSTLAVAATFLLAAFTRLYLVDTLPPGLKYDSASNGVYILGILYDGTLPFYANPMGAPEPLILYMQSATVWLFGANVFALRIVPALAALLTVVALYGCAREFVADRRVALVAAFALTISLENIHNARAGIRFMLVPLFEAALLYFFWRGWRHRSRRDLVLAGVVLGLSVYTYLAALMLPLVILALWAHQFLLTRARRWDVLWTLGVGGIIALPRIIFHLMYPAAAMARASQVNLLQNPEVANVGLGNVVLAHLLEYVKMFGIDWQGGSFRQPLPDPILFVLFIIGVAVALARWRQIEWFWPLVALAIMFLPDLLAANEPIPNKVRTIGIVPPTYFLVGVGASAVLDRFRQRAVRIVLIALLMVSAVTSSNAYFVQTLAATPASREFDDFNISPLEVAEAQWIAQQTEPVYLPLNEFARSPVHYLVGARAPRLRSALRADGSLDPQAVVARGWLVLPENPERARSEGKIYVDDPAAFVLVNGDTVYLLPPTQFDRPTRSPDVVIRDPNARVAAQAYAVGPINFRAPPAPAPVKFSQGIELVSSAIDLARAQPGETVPVSLYWRVAQRTADDHVIFVHLLDVTEQVAANADILPALGAYNTFLWKPGELIPTHHTIQVPRRTPPGQYRVEVGLYNVLSQNRLDVLDARGNAAESRVVIGTVKVAPRQTLAYNPEHPQRIVFGDNLIALLGYDIRDDRQVTLYWQALSEMDRDYTVFVHVLDREGKIVAQNDHQPQDGNYPTGIWEPGENVRDDFALTIPDNAPDGTYRIMIGWYDFKTGARLPVRDAGGDAAMLDLPLEVRR
ncbi:MAG: glycosyltransferase family 39 protein [Chloroflexi bacterium]|nr:glycosyltransferase family 39 protein [Chloroflexota bacterium]